MPYGEIKADVVRNSDGGTLDLTNLMEKSGGDFTGNVTLGTNKVTLDASSGSATFNGAVTCGSGSDVAVDGKGAGVFYRATATTTDNVFVAQSDVGGTQSTIAFIDAAGDTTFTGNIDSGDLSAGAGSRLGNGSVIARRNTFSTSNQVSLNATISSTEYSIAAFPTGTADVKFGIGIDGSASFASDITLGDFNISSTTVSGTKIHSSGAIQMQRPSGATASSRVTIFSGTTPTVQLLDNGNAEFGTYSSNGTTIFGSGSVAVNRTGSGSTCFYALLNGAEMATISAGGLIKTGDPNVNGGISLVADDFGLSTQRGRQTFRAKAGTSGIQEMLQGFIGTTEQIRITVNGNIKNTNNSYGSLSDGTLKENIVPASTQWDNIKDIEVVNFNFKEDLGYEAHKQLGVIAQQVEEVSPGLVDTDEEGLKSVNYSVLYMKSVKALQEAMARIESLEARVAQLEELS